MLRIGFVGTPGSGKTTLCRATALACQKIKGIKRVELVSEYARRYISKYGKINSIMEQFRVLEKQLDWENSICTDKLDIMLTDSPIFLGFLYCCQLPKIDPKEIMFFNDIFKKMVKLNYPTPRYDIIFHLDTSLKPVDDGVREKKQFEDVWREKADTMIRAMMEIFKPKQFIPVGTTSMDKRTEFCLKQIRNSL